MTLTPSTILVIGVIGLFAVGFYGMLVLRNLFHIIIALQILVKGAVLGLIAASSHVGQVNLGQSLAVTVIVADTAVAVVAMALAVQVKQRVGTLDVKALSTLRR
ncbi:MAG TPA: NADH-quinone oxidoreductase subunit K [Candidatus Sulfomarinibacteraceae bacterium]|nr:NADH-quinone oxidoreductase subunit K [Candidatus Sulfomarinibacteraceae bacterium]